MKPIDGGHCFTSWYIWLYSTVCDVYNLFLNDFKIHKYQPVLQPQEFIIVSHSFKVMYIKPLVRE